MESKKAPSKNGKEKATKLRAALKRKHVYMPADCSLVKMGNKEALEYAGLTEKEFIANIRTSETGNGTTSQSATSTPRPGPSGITLRRRKKVKNPKYRDFITSFDTTSDMDDFA
ncbi:uncharacterized protein [Clytia hemisphaerica]|uniref:uncharacterized protein n=1 Tax=Clytia hemisphaerica TaxID=252671 RepID=UPI0034D50447